MIKNAIIHILNELPIMVDIEELPTATDLTFRCTNVRTVDGKRPTFVHDVKNTFIVPLSVVRMIEAPLQAEAFEEHVSASALATAGSSEFDDIDEEASDDLLARIREV